RELTLFVFSSIPLPPRSTLFPYTTLFRSYALMASAALGTLVWRHPLADVAARSMAPIGAAFTFLALVTGSLWGKPMWGTYWVWEDRKSTRLNSSHVKISYAVFCLKKKNKR